MALDHNLIAGLYADKEQALRVMTQLQDEGLRPERLALEEPRGGDRQDGGDLGASQVIRDAGLGAVIGGGVGAAAAAGVAAVAAPALFAGAPLLGPLLAAGYGTAIGGTAGAAAGLRLAASKFSETLEEALDEGYTAVIVKATDDRQREIAERVFAETSRERPLQAQ